LKGTLYILIFALLIFGLTTPSCKTAKTTANTKSSNTQTKNTGEQEQIKFAYYFVEACKERMRGNIESAENLYKE